MSKEVNIRTNPTQITTWTMLEIKRNGRKGKENLTRVRNYKFWFQWHEHLNFGNSNRLNGKPHLILCQIKNNRISIQWDPMGSNGIIYKMNFIFKLFASYVPSITTFPTLRKVFVRRLRISFYVRRSYWECAKNGSCRRCSFFLLTPKNPAIGVLLLVTKCLSITLSQWLMYYQVYWIHLRSHWNDAANTCIRYSFMYCVVPWFIS